jgi:hypothetical protein
VRSVPIAADGAIANVGWYHGLSIKETAGAAAVVTLHDGASAAAALLDVVNLNANESVRDNYSPPVYVSSGQLWFEVVSGAVSAVVRVTH